MSSRSQQRLSMISNSSGAPNRNSGSRHHAHSVSLGSINTSNRVTRRRSNASNVNSVAALRAALDESTKVLDIPKHGQSRPTLDLGRNNSNDGDQGYRAKPEDSAIADGFLPARHNNGAPKARARRASEGSHLIKGEGKRSSGELRWEHDPAWAYTSKLLISKHQQVQLLEAASVLVNMNVDADLEPLKRGESDSSSLSPGASGSSETNDDYYDAYSSAETTPPPTAESYSYPEGISTGRTKRSSGLSSLYSRSYQSAPSSSLPGISGFPHYTSGMSGEEESGLAAAVETLCSFGTPRSGPVLLPSDVPPVPPLPARYAEEHQATKSGSIFAQSDLGLPSPSYQPLSSEREVLMIPSRGGDYPDYDDRNMAHEEDEGVFGSMEGIAHDAHEELFSHRA
ncbi:uncharacterized protein KY384_001045 [Bacidia gigantensis]|uniref:uncharacterized protein n=1 Tax=Bacidia gigantensis TaxID=2732470 RepID=UPI001D056129|nr:uncharacterized protein KY384_001045 [Bacidia gigantensis]KAG8534201.1 hypothetical protein KY384_001045 [Bacidia gigantensis]